MENQHRKIDGYRELNEYEIHCMNRIKKLGEEVRKLLDELYTMGGGDELWLKRAEEKLQYGFMAAVRAVAKPTTF